MKDNLSIIILMIVFVTLVVLFPVYNFFERQDDMSYNLALRQTTTFVEKVLNNGYMDEEMYNDFVQALSNTNNLYDIQIEAHRQVITPDPDNTSLYVTQYRIDYTDDIFDIIGQDTKSATLNIKKVKNGMYTLNQGDQFYVKLKNSSTTLAGALFNSIISTSTKERIVVNYGGFVKNEAWKVIDARYEKVSDDTFSIATNLASNNAYQNPGNINSTGTQAILTSATLKISNASYDKCTGKFEKISSYKRLFRVDNQNSLPKANMNCVASLQEGWTDIIGYSGGEYCDKCGKKTLGFTFNLKCKLCGYTENYKYIYCVNCRLSEMGLKSSTEKEIKENMRFVLGYHEASLGEKIKATYETVDVFKCNTCSAMYKKYSLSKKVEGVEGRHI